MSSVSNAALAKNLWSQDNVAEKYKIAENASRPFCKIMVEKSGISESTSEANVFDLATGTGALIQELYDAVPKEKWGNLKVLGGDISEGMLEYLKKRGEREGWTGLETRVVDGNKIDLPKGTFTHVFVSFAIFQLPTALPQLYELLKPGGFIAVDTHAATPWQPLLAQSIGKVPEKPYSPSSRELLDKMYFDKPWYEEKFLASQLSEAGFHNVETLLEKKQIAAGPPETFVETMQFPMKIVTAFWDESKRDQWLKEVNEHMLEEARKVNDQETGNVMFQFECLIGYGYKSA